MNGNGLYCVGTISPPEPNISPPPKSPSIEAESKGPGCERVNQSYFRNKINSENSEHL